MSDGTHNYQAAKSVTLTTTGNIDDLDIDGAGMLIMNNATLATLRGIAAGYNGKVLGIISIGAGAVDLAHQDTNSAAANRFVNPTSGTIRLPAGVGAAFFQYNAASARWRMMAAANVAILNEENVFTGNRNYLTTSNGPQLIFNDTGEAVDQRKFRLQANAGSLTMEAVDDAETVATVLWNVARGGLATVSSLLVGAGQVTFPAVQNPSAGANTLDDYEEGTWTPTIGGVGGQSGQVYSAQVGHYVKIGQLVEATFGVTLSTLGSITGAVQIAGLPFSSLNVSGYRSVVPIFWVTLTTAYVLVQGSLNDNTTAVILFVSTAATTNMAAANAAQADLAATTRFVGTVIYRANA